MQRYLDFFKWLYPGMRVKRWLVVVLFGALLTSTGLFLALSFAILDLLNWLGRIVFYGTAQILPKISLIAGLITMLIGYVCIFIGIRQLVRSVTSVVAPDPNRRLADLVYRRRFLAQGERIVVIGGGTGLATMLRGLKEYTSNITAVVTVTDEGGSSGRLVREFGVLPPGDVRNCLTALADEEVLMSRLLDYRFDTGQSDLHGHSLGNLLLAAMTRLSGNFDLAIRETSRVLAIRGTVLPSTLDHVRLRAEFVDGSCAEGELDIVEQGKNQPVMHLSLVPAYAKALPEVLEAIRKAAVVVIGPGSLYTSVLPNLLLPEVREALEQTKARKVYVCNVMTQPGETDGFSASDHIRALIEHAGPHVLDTVLVNQQIPSEEVLKRYAGSGSDWVRPDVEKIRQMGYRAIRGNFMNEGDVVRHDSAALAHALLYLLR
ncbi:MAG: YvcK family protein [Armatimonadetes bacterium]|nr:YvcK family protein [Armatimonadota bacterium]